MKRIEFISPVAAMRGNMSGTQRLKYPLHDNRAYEGPDNSVNYARNYRPSYIGTKRASDGRCSFHTKRKSANHLTVKAKAAMSNLGGVGAIYSALVRDKMSKVYINAKGCYDDAVAGGYTGTFRKYMSSYIKPALNAKSETIDITTAKHSVSIDNPWVKVSASLNIRVSDSALVKFWMQFAWDPMYFYVGGKKGVCHVGNSFNILIVQSSYNVLGLEDDDEAVMLDGMYLIDSDGNAADFYTPILDIYSLSPELP